MEIRHYKQHCHMETQAFIINNQTQSIQRTFQGIPWYGKATLITLLSHGNS